VSQVTKHDILYVYATRLHERLRRNRRPAFPTSPSPSSTNSELPFTIPVPADTFLLTSARMANDSVHVSIEMLSFVLKPTPRPQVASSSHRPVRCWSYLYPGLGHYMDIP
jgi:hypothetical protein